MSNAADALGYVVKIPTLPDFGNMFCALEIKGNRHIATRRLREMYFIFFVFCVCGKIVDAGADKLVSDDHLFGVNDFVVDN